MAPRKQRRGAWRRLCRLENACHYQGADLEVDCIGIGGRAGVMAETAVGVSATQRPAGRPPYRFPTVRTIPAQLSQHKHRIKSRMAIA